MKTTYSLVKVQLLIQAGFPGRGIGSNGRAPALHAGGTGIDTQILHFFFFELNVFAAMCNHTDLSCLPLYPLKQPTYFFKLATHFFFKN